MSIKHIPIPKTKTKLVKVNATPATWIEVSVDIPDQTAREEFIKHWKNPRSEKYAQDTIVRF